MITNGEDNDDVDDETTKSAQSPAITINDNGNSENQLFIGAAVSASGGSADVKSKARAHTHTTTGTGDIRARFCTKIVQQIWRTCLVSNTRTRNVHTWSFVGVLTFARVQVEGASGDFFLSSVALLLSMRASSSQVIT